MMKLFIALEMTFKDLLEGENCRSYGY